MTTFEKTKEQKLREFGFNDDDFEIYDTGTIGLGIKAKKNFKRGDYVITYFGEIIDEKEAKRRMNDPEGTLLKTGDTYIFYIKKNLWVDGDIKTNTAKLFNHHCEGNLKFIIDKNKAVVKFYAKKEIKIGDVMNFNYMLEIPKSISIVCKCGSQKCKGEINMAIVKNKK